MSQPETSSTPPEAQSGFEAPDPERPASAAPTERELEQETPKVGALDHAPPGEHDPYSALRFRDYRLFSLGWFIAVIGAQMTATALGWEIFDRTGSQLKLGYLAGVQAIPLIFLALPAGVLADRFDRRRVIQVTSILYVLCAVALAMLSYRGPVVWIFLVVLAASSVMTTSRPARSAILPTIVPPWAFSNAITWNASIFQTATMVGPAMAGAVIALSLRHFHNVRIAYLIDAGCALTFTILMFFLPPPPYAAKRSTERQPLLATVAAGVRFVWDNPIILGTMTLDLFAVLLGGAAYLMPVFAKSILHVGSVGFGWLRAAEAIGAVTMAMLLAHLPPMKHAGRSMLLAVAGFGLATIVFALSRSFLLSFVMIFLVGAFDNISVVVRHTLVQVLTPDEMRGRVSAVNNIFIGASNELGGLESGVTAAGFGALAAYFGASPASATTLGPVLSVVFGGVGTLVVVAVIAWVWPQIRRYGPLQPH